MTYRRGRQTAEEANRLSFRTAKNEIKNDILKLQLADQRRMQETWRATEKSREAAEAVEALGLPKLSDQAGEFKADMLQAFKPFESGELEPSLQDLIKTLEELPAERATSRSLELLEDAKGGVRALATLSEELDRNAAGYMSNLREAIDLYRDLLDQFTEDDSYEPEEEEPTR